jgi:hypothetical protein
VDRELTGGHLSLRPIGAAEVYALCVGPESEAESVRFHGRRVAKGNWKSTRTFFGLRGAT